MSFRSIVSSAFLVAVILIGAVWSNNVLDSFDVATDGAFTVQQRKQNAARNQAEWDSRKVSR